MQKNSIVSKKNKSSKIKSKMPESITTSWHIIPAPIDLFNGNLSMNELLRSRGFNVSPEKEKMNDFHDMNSRIAINLICKRTKNELKEFVKKIDSFFIHKLYPKEQQYLQKFSDESKKRTIAQDLADDLYFKITSPNEYFSRENILEFEKIVKLIG